MLASTRALLTGILDYAGTFPPASLSLNESVANYVRVWSSADRWLLGRLIVPSASLPELNELSAQREGLPRRPVRRSATRREGGSAQREGGELSVVLGAQAATQLPQALQFIGRQDTTYRIASLEFPPLSPSEIGDVGADLPDTIEAFFEVPIDAELDARLDAITAIGAFAKVRTGGITTGVFPGPEGLVRFLEACSSAGVAFKATAGLHHAVRGCYPLTYEPGSPTETMHGFLNVSVAAAIIYAGGGSSEAVAALRETSAEIFEFRAEALVWRGRTIAADDLAASRLFFRSFGSCSVHEPIDELARLRLL
jgi:hypothetical protein